MTKSNQYSGHPFNDIFSYLKKKQEESSKMVVSLGLLIDSGGIIGILTHTAGKLTGQLKTAFMFFLVSIILLFTVEMMKSIGANKSIEQLFREEKTNLNIDIVKFTLFKGWFNKLCYFINFGTVACGIYGIWISIKYLQAI
jgi:succinate dehydrogenase hydrophobic anchor subunit